MHTLAAPVPGVGQVTGTWEALKPLLDMQDVEFVAHAFEVEWELRSDLCRVMTRYLADRMADELTEGA